MNPPLRELALALEGEFLGVNIFIVPTIKNRLDGAISVQIKLRVW